MSKSALGYSHEILFETRILFVDGEYEIVFDLHLSAIYTILPIFAPIHAVFKIQSGGLLLASIATLVIF